MICVYIAGKEKKSQGVLIPTKEQCCFCFLFRCSATPNTSPILISFSFCGVNVQSLSLETLSSWLQILSEASLATVALHTYGLWG